MALAATPAQYDPTGILLKQRVLYIKAGVVKEITAKIIADEATALAAHQAADALLTGAAATAEAAADAAAAAALLAAENKSWQS